MRRAGVVSCGPAGHSARTRPSAGGVSAAGAGVRRHAEVGRPRVLGWAVPAEPGPPAVALSSRLCGRRRYCCRGWMPGLGPVALGRGSWGASPRGGRSQVRWVARPRGLACVATPRSAAHGCWGVPGRRSLACGGGQASSASVAATAPAGRYPALGRSRPGCGGLGASLRGGRPRGRWVGRPRVLGRRSLTCGGGLSRPVLRQPVLLLPRGYPALGRWSPARWSWGASPRGAWPRARWVGHAPALGCAVPAESRPARRWACRAGSAAAAGRRYCPAGRSARCARVAGTSVTESTRAMRAAIGRDAARVRSSGHTGRMSVQCARSTRTIGAGSPREP